MDCDNNSIMMLAVGDKGCGKASLMTALSPFEEENQVEIQPFSSEVVSIDLEGKRVTLVLNTISGVEDKDDLRKGMLIYTHVVLLCFAIDDPDSLKSIKSKWLPEIQEYFPNVPFVVVGNKRDLRNLPKTFKLLAEKNQKPVKMMEAECLAMQINAYAYVECSYTHNDGLLSVFRTAAHAALDSKAYQSLCEGKGDTNENPLDNSANYSPELSPGYIIVDETPPPSRQDNPEYYKQRYSTGYSPTASPVHYSSQGMSSYPSPQHTAMRYPQQRQGEYIYMEEIPPSRPSSPQYYHRDGSPQHIITSSPDHYRNEAYYNYQEMQQPRYYKRPSIGRPNHRDSYQYNPNRTGSTQYQRETQKRKSVKQFYREDILDGCNLYIWNLPDETTEDYLIELFSPYGNILSAKIVPKSESKNAVYGFVLYDNPQSAQNAIKELHEFQIGRKSMGVQLKRKE